MKDNPIHLHAVATPQLGTECGKPITATEKCACIFGVYFVSADLRVVHVLTWWTSARYLPWRTEKNYYSAQHRIEFARFAVSAAVLLVNQFFLDVTLSWFLRNIGNYPLSETASRHRKLDFCVYICSTFIWWILPNDVYRYEYIYFHF